MQRWKAGTINCKTEPHVLAGCIIFLLSISGNSKHCQSNTSLAPLFNGTSLSSRESFFFFSLPHQNGLSLHWSSLSIVLGNHSPTPKTKGAIVKFWKNACVMIEAICVFKLYGAKVFVISYLEPKVAAYRKKKAIEIWTGIGPFTTPGTLSPRNSHRPGWFRPIMLAFMKQGFL